MAMAASCFWEGVWVGFSAPLLPSMLVLAWLLFWLPGDSDLD